MSFIIRHVVEDDLQALLMIEQASFSEAEAATKDAFERRIRHIADSFLVAQLGGEVVGLINGPVVQTEFITDDLFAEIVGNPASGGHQAILGLAVAPHKREQGIGRALLEQLEQEARDKQRETVTLTCLAHLVGYYEQLGYVNKGISSSTHGGEQWFNMSKVLEVKACK